MPANGQYLFPPELYYDRDTHVWVRYDGEIARLGLDALGLESLGDMAFVTVQAVGQPARRGESIGSLEAAKMVGDLIAPISGVIAARNQAALSDPSLVNRDPYGEGWLVELMPSDWAGESRELVHGAALAGWIEGEVERYRSQGWIE